MMFEHFTLGAQPQPRHIQDDPNVSASPTDIISARDSKQKQREADECSIPEIPSINDLLDRLADSDLHLKDHGSHESAPAVRRLDTTLCNTNTVSASLYEDDYDYDDDDEADDEEAARASMVYHSTRRGLTNVRYIDAAPRPAAEPSEGEADCRRLLRRINTQLQSCEKHVKDIETLVDNMISTGEQCTLHTSASRQHHPPSQSSSILHNNTEVQQLPQDEHPDDEEVLVGGSASTVIQPETQIHLELDIDDEGFAEMNEDEFLEDSIANTFQDTSRCSGIRKRLMHPYMLRARGLGDGLCNSYQAKGKPRLRCVTRMRKRREGGRVNR